MKEVLKRKQRLSLLTLGGLIFSNQKAWTMVAQKNGKQDLGIYVTASTLQRPHSQKKNGLRKKNLSISKDDRQVVLAWSQMKRVSVNWKMALKK